MALNKIVKYNLKTKAIDLKREGKSNELIASLLSNDSNLEISESSVQRFFESHDKDVAEFIQKSEKLQSRIVEAEISTIEGRISVIDKLLSVFETCESIHDIQTISREIKEHYDSLDKCRGKWTSVGVNIDNSKTENSVNVVLHLPRKNPYPGTICQQK